MSINIDDINKNKNNKIIKEILEFGAIFAIILTSWWLFINAQLVWIILSNTFWWSVKANDIILSTPSKEIKINKENIIEKNKWDNLEEFKRKLLEKKLDKKLDRIKWSKKDLIYKPSYKLLIKWNLQKYSVKFNTLPPNKRIIIPKINVDVPIVTITNVEIKTIETAEYDKYLYNGVVKYPYTPDPWKKWNVFIFWHTSYYWWKKNPYWTVFSNIPALRHGDKIQLVWDSKVYTYKIFKKLIVYPNQVDDVYRKYNNWEFITIMWCYPIGSDAKRMLIIWKRIKK